MRGRRSSKVNWQAFVDAIDKFFGEFGNNALAYVVEFIVFSVLLFYVFKVLQTNKNYKFFAAHASAIVWCGLAFE